VRRANALKALDDGNGVDLVCRILYRGGGMIHVFLDNVRYHDAKVLKPFLERPERRVRVPRRLTPRTSTPSRDCGA